MIGEISLDDPFRRARYLRPDEMHQAFTFTVTDAGWDARRLRYALSGAQEVHTQTGAISTWVMSNHDIVRHATRLGYPRGAIFEGGIGPSDPRPDVVVGLERAIAYTAFLLALPGSAYLYNGEELGLPEVLDLPDDARRDPTWPRTKGRAYGRDGCRVPLPWTGDVDADWGGKPWLPWPEDWEAYAAAAQEKDPSSPLSRYREMLRLRDQLGLGTGDWEVLRSDPDVVAVRAGDILTALNLGVGEREVSAGGTVLFSTGKTVERDGSIWLAPNSAAWIRL